MKIPENSKNSSTEQADLRTALQYLENHQFEQLADWAENHPNEIGELFIRFYEKWPDSDKVTAILAFSMFVKSLIS